MWEKRDDDLHGRGGAVTALDHVVPFPAGRVLEEVGLACEEVGEEPHVVGVVGDDEEVEGAREPGGLASGGGDLLTSGEPVGVARVQACAKRAGVHGEGCVEVGVAEVGSSRKFTVGVGGVGLVGAVHALGVFLIEGAGVLGDRGRRSNGENCVRTGSNELRSHRSPPCGTTDPRVCTR